MAVAGIDFTWQVRVDGSNIAPITLKGGSISYGRRDLIEQPNVPYCVVEILTQDAYPPAKTLYPEFGLGDWATDLSGFVDTYADAYAGVTSRLTIGVPLEIDMQTSAGMIDTYTDDYEGYTSRRFTGRVTALDYTPGSIQLTATPRSEEWARIDVGGTAVDETIPSEFESERAIRVAAEAGVSLIVDGPPSVQVVAIPPETPATPLMGHLVALMAGTGGYVYTDRQGWVHVETRDYVRPFTETVFIPPGMTLVDPLLMSLDLGLVRNRVTVEYGPLANEQGGLLLSDTWQFKTGTGDPGVGNFGRTDDGSPSTGETITLRISHTSLTGGVYTFVNLTTAMRIELVGTTVGDVWRMDIDTITHTVQGATGYTTVTATLTSVNGAIGNNENTFLYFYSPDVKQRPTYVVQDDAQIAQYGIRDYKESTPILSGGDAAVYATDRLNLLSPMWLLPDATLLMDLGDLVTVAAICDIEQGTPVEIPQLLPGSPMQDYPGIVLGYTETLGQTDWSIVLHMTRRYGDTEYGPEWIYPAPNTYLGE